jgi:hypothetical protein
VCGGIRKIVREFCRAARKSTFVAGDDQHARGQTGKRSRVEDRGRDQCQGCDPLRVEGREVMPIPERRRPTGDDVSSLDAEMLKQIEQTGFDGTRCWRVQIFAPLFKKADQFDEYLSAADCKHILIDRIILKS